MIATAALTTTLGLVALIGFIVLFAGVAIVLAAAPLDELDPLPAQPAATDSHTRPHPISLPVLGPGVAPYFAAPTAGSSIAVGTEPLDADSVQSVLAMLERHVRAEQAAADRFLSAPTPTGLAVHDTSLTVH